MNSNKSVYSPYYQITRKGTSKKGRGYTDLEKRQASFLAAGERLSFAAHACLRGFAKRLSNELQGYDLGSILEHGKQALDHAINGETKQAIVEIERQLQAILDEKRADIVASLNERDAKSIVLALNLIGYTQSSRQCRDSGVHARMELIRQLNLPPEKQQKIFKILDEPREMSTLAKKLEKIDQVQSMQHPVVTANVHLEPDAKELDSSNNSPTKPQSLLNVSALRERKTCTFTVEWLQDEEGKDERKLPTCIAVEVAGFTQAVSKSL